MLCIAYVIAVGMLLGAVAVLVERILPPGWPRRWIWCLVMPVAVGLPGYYRWHHNWSVLSALERHGDPTSALVPAAASFALIDPAWWAQTSNYDSTINALWLITSATLIVWGLANSWRVWRLVRVARRRSSVRAPLLLDGVPIVLTETVGPATAGLLRSRVLVPRWVLGLPETERHYVVRHEEEHRRAHDAQLLFIASLPLVLMPWNLAYWWLLRRLCAAVEMDCDNRVVGAAGDAHAYGELLLRVAAAGTRGPRLQPALLGVGTLERRLAALVAPTPLRHFQRFLVPALALGLLAIALSMPHPVLRSGPHAHSTPVATTNSTRLP